MRLLHLDAKSSVWRGVHKISPVHFESRVSLEYFLNKADLLGYNFTLDHGYAPS